MQNPVRWFEIYVEKMERAKPFYEGVFDTKLTAMTETPEFEMWGFPSNPDGWGCSGTLVRMQGLKPSGVSSVVYFGSEDCAIEEGRIVSLGGKLHRSKFSIGQYGFITLGIDTEGNMFGIHSMK